MSRKINERLQELIDTEAKKKHTHLVLLGVQSKDGRVDFAGAAGQASPESPYFIASITKMYTVAVIMQLVDEGKLDLEAHLSTYLPADLLDGIHVYKGVEYNQQLKVYQLLHQTSGLADYFEGKPKTGESLMTHLIRGEDRAYTIGDVKTMISDMSPKFAPDANNGRKSHYSDTNYQLLGAVIESITEKSLEENYQSRIFDPLGLAHSYLYDGTIPADEPSPLPFYHKDRVAAIPLAMSSERAAGGIVSTVPESLTFLRAYFEGRSFSRAHFDRMQRWNSLFFPIQYGYGLMRFKLPRVMTLFRYSPELIGHSGSSGSFAFYAPREGLYIAGTFNQADKPSRPFFFMVKALNALS